MPTFVALESLAVPTLGVDSGGNVVFTNNALRALLGYSLDELIGQPLGALVASHRTDCPLAKLYAYAGELVGLTHRDGHLVWVQATRSTMQPHLGSCALIAFADYTETLRRNEIFGHRSRSTARPRCCPTDHLTGRIQEDHR